MPLHSIKQDANNHQGVKNAVTRKGDVNNRKFVIGSVVELLGKSTYGTHGIVIEIDSTTIRVLVCRYDRKESKWKGFNRSCFKHHNVCIIGEL